MTSGVLVMSGGLWHRLACPMEIKVRLPEATVLPTVAAYASISLLGE